MIFIYIYVHTLITYQYISIAYNLWIPLAGFGRPKKQIGPLLVLGSESAIQVRQARHVGRRPEEMELLKVRGVHGSPCWTNHPLDIAIIQQKDMKNLTAIKND